MDAYNTVCKNLPKLCPRLVPSPLWKYSLTSFACLDPYIAIAICEDCDDTARMINDFWFKQKRERCEVCGDIGSDLDEDWRYYVDGKKGVSELVGFRVLCEKCYLAKHQEFAKVSEKEDEALEHLAKVNGVSSVKDIVNEAFLIHSRLSQIKDWTFKLSTLNEPLKSKAEKLLNTAYKNGFYPEDSWLYHIGKNYGKIEDESIKRTIQLLKSGEDLLSVAILSLLGEAEVVERNLASFLKWLILH